jgi:hypothetical protein
MLLYDRYLSLMGGHPMKVFRFLSVAVSLCVMGLTGQAAWAGFAGPVMTEGGLIQVAKRRYGIWPKHLRKT